MLRPFLHSKGVSYLKHLFYIKLLIKSLYFWVGFSFVLFILGWLLTMPEHSAFQISKHGLYGFFVMNILFISYSIHAYSASYKEIQFLGTDRLLKLKNVLTSFSILNCLIGGIFFCIVSIWVDKSLPFSYNIRGILTFEWIVIYTNMLSILIGLFFSSFLSNKLAYLLSYFTYAFFIHASLEIPITPVKYILKIFDPTTVIEENLISGLIWNKLYLYKQIILLLFLVFIYQLAIIMIVRKKTVLRYSLLLINAAILLGSITYQNSLGEFDLVNAQTPSYLSIPNTIKVENYKMLGEIGNTFKNKVSITIKECSLDTLEFFLDESFTVSNITVDGKKVVFKQSEDKYTLDLSAISSNDFNLDIMYQGSPYKTNSLGVPFVYTSMDNINFPAYNIAWYPVIGMSNNPTIEIDFTNHFPVYTTMDSQNHFKDGISIFAGAYTTYKKDEIEYVIPTLATSFTKKRIYDNVEKLKKEDKQFEKVIIGAIKPGDYYYIENRTLIIY